MGIITALCLLKEGKKVREKSWSKDSYYVLDKNGRLVNEDGSTDAWIIITNLNDNDWEIYEG